MTVEPCAVCGREPDNFLWDAHDRGHTLSHVRAVCACHNEYTGWYVENWNTRQREIRLGRACLDAGVESVEGVRELLAAGVSWLARFHDRGPQPQCEITTTALDELTAQAQDLGMCKTTNPHEREEAVERECLRAAYGEYGQD